MIGLRYTEYFENIVMPRRPYLRREWCEAVVFGPLRIQIQDDGRIRFWGAIRDRPGYYLRVVTLEDGLTVLNAFFDGGFRL
jgi:hypothetical protein